MYNSNLLCLNKVLSIISVCHCTEGTSYESDDVILSFHVYQYTAAA